MMTTGNLPVQIALLALTIAPLGCTRLLPPLSHAHIGHALTAWRDTPDEQGLFVVAEREVATAIAEARAAARLSQRPAAADTHLRNVVHALNPDRQAAGTGADYGAIRALQSSIDHIEFAANTDDASDGVRNTSTEFASHGHAVIAHLRDTVTLTEQAIGATTPEVLAGDVDVLLGRLAHAARGTDIDADGNIGSHPSETGLVQLRQQLSDMVNAEVPAYEPIGKRILFGVVRLPNGNWAYRFDRSAPAPDAAQSGNDDS